MVALRLPILAGETGAHHGTIGRRHPGRRYDLVQKGDDMNPNQRSEVNNQTNNGANEKWTPGSQGKTIAEGPLDHTYPQGASQQQGQGQVGTQQSGVGPAAPTDVTQQRGAAGAADLQGGSMQTQQTGGTGAVQGITDSHQRAMEERSGAYGQLEQPVGERSRQADTPQGSSQSGQGSMGSRQGGGQLGGGEQRGQQGGGQMGQSNGTPSVQGGGSMGAEQSTDRGGSQTGAGNYQGGAGTHMSNDTAGGLPRSPGNTGASGGPTDTHLTGAQVHANQQQGSGVHKSNDLAGGYPKSPGGANKLAADEKMDDDTGFSNKP
jgi:hypothetical protein